MRAAGQIDARESLARPDGSLDEHGRILVRIGAVERGTPGPADRHRLVLAAQADQEVDEARRVNVVTVVVALFGHAAAALVDLLHLGHRDQHHLEIFAMLHLKNPQI